MAVIITIHSGRRLRTGRTRYNSDVAGTTSSFLRNYQTDVLGVIQAIDLEKIGQVIEALARARDEGRRIFVCGNGGSASTASHFVCDLVKGASYQRDKRFKIMALTDS